MFNFEELKKLDEKQKLAVHCLWQGLLGNQINWNRKARTRP